jgi:hypothetical protein
LLHGTIVLTAAFRSPTTVTAPGTHWVVTMLGAHCLVVVGDGVGNDRYDV